MTVPPHKTTAACKVFVLSPFRGALLPPQYGEVREDWEDWRGLVRSRLQVQKQRHGPDRRHQEVCRVRG